MFSYITSIGTAVPMHQIEQHKAADWMADALQLSSREHKVVKALYDATGIQTRHTVIPDFLNERKDFKFFTDSPDLEPFPTVAERMAIYKQEALPLSLEAIEKCFSEGEINKEEITHLITVSCTGMYAPGLDIDIIDKLGLESSTQRTAIHFMGCYAAFNGLKTADYICKAEPEAKVLVICIELCTLHFQKGKDRDNLLSNALFSDGAAAILVESKPKDGTSFAIENFRCELAINGKNDMAWHIGNNGFEMTLSSYVPQFIKGGIKELSTKLLQKMNLKLADVDRFAIHPGGRRILEVCEEELGLSKEDMCFSYETLFNYGNMSSPTVIFVLDGIRKVLGRGDDGKRLLSFAFGPGLTMESMLLKIHHA